MANQPDSYNCDSTCSSLHTGWTEPWTKTSINKRERNYDKRQEETGFLKYSLTGNRRAEGHFGKVNRREKRGERYWECAVMYRPFTAFPAHDQPQKTTKTWEKQLVASPKDSFLTTIRDAQWTVILVGNRQKLQYVWHCTSYQTTLSPIPVKRQEIRMWKICHILNFSQNNNRDQ